MGCKHPEKAPHRGAVVCTECGEILEGLKYCEGCATDYEVQCLCAKYRKHMEWGLDFLVPQWWQRENWHRY